MNKKKLSKDLAPRQETKHKSQIKSKQVTDGIISFGTQWASLV